jgi:hypothetical protein
MLDDSMRVFSTGGLRSPSKGKIDFFGYREPLLENSFGRYMLKHQVMEDGNIRSPDNWQKGWPCIVSLQSMIRHCEDLQALEAGYKVYKVRDEDGEKTVYSKLTTVNKGVKVDKEETVNAIRFNCASYLLQHLKEKYGDDN